jgi:uncharacterized protein (TIGR02996 family)
MTDCDAFQRTIAENPDDDAPRLVFADWLEEQGDLRGEFIRIQCALAQMQIDDSRRPQLAAREQALLMEHGDAWLGKLKTSVKSYCFRRGFVDWVSLPGRKFLEIADELFESAPIRELRLTHLGMGNFPATKLAMMPQFARLDALELAGVAGDERVATILKSPHLKQLTRLQLDEVRGGEQTFKTIFNGAFPRLDALELVGGAPGELVCRPKIALREFAIKSQEGVLNRDQVIELARAKKLAGLTLLDLRNSRVQVPGAAAIANSKVLTQLQVLGLKGCAIGVHGMQALGGSDKLVALKALNVEGNHFGINGLRGLLEARCEQLTSLNLANNDLDDRCMTLLREWPGLRRLRYLNLASNPIQDATMAKLVAAPELAHLWHLEFSGLPGNETAEALKSVPHLAGMIHQKPHMHCFSRFYRQPKAHSGNRVNIH